jgi:hypothetical protein
MNEAANTFELPELTGRYVYCVAGGELDAPAAVGLDGCPIRAVSAAGFTAFLHDCPPAPYHGDDDQVASWVVAHGEVVDAVWEKSDPILPLAFDTIIRAEDGTDPDDQVRRWLEAEKNRFGALVESLRGKVELGVQVFWISAAMAKLVADGDEQICRLREEMAGKPKGMAYFYQQKIERALRLALEIRADADYRLHFRKIVEICPEVRVNPLRKAPDRQMILNLSVLAPRGRVPELGDVVAGFQTDGTAVRFTGPWPPYSFVRPGPPPSPRDGDPAVTASRAPERSS